MSRGRNKYGARRTEVGGHKFASLKEAQRWTELDLLRSRGVITDLELQPKFPLVVGGVLSRPVLLRSAGYPNGRKAKYTADFRYIENGHTVVEEVKGGRATDTEASRLRRAVAEAIYDMRVRVV